MQYGKVGVVSGGVHQVYQQLTGEAPQRRLPGVGRTQLERRDTEAVAPLVSQIHHETLIAEHREQVIDAGPGQVQVAGDGRGRDRFGMVCRQLQDGQGLTGCGGVGHEASVSGARRAGSVGYGLERMDS